MGRKAVQIIRGIYKGGETDVDIDAEMKWTKEKAEKRRLWEEDFARRKEDERLRLARESGSRLQLGQAKQVTAGQHHQPAGQ